jgi:hypothetical protein
MEQVTGIGGVFFRARDPAALAQRFRDHLGVMPVPADYDELPWQQEAGPAAFAPFPADSRFFRMGGGGRLYDPEGNAMELWESRGRDTR